MGYEGITSWNISCKIPQPLVYQEANEYGHVLPIGSLTCRYLFDWEIQQNTFDDISNGSKTHLHVLDYSVVV